MMEMQDLQRSWDALNARVDQLEERLRTSNTQLALVNSRSLQTKLRNRYLIQAATGIVLLPMIAPFLLQLGLPVWLAIAYGGVGMLMGVMNLIMAIYIGKNNYLSLPVVEAVSHAAAIIKWQYRLRIVLYLLLLLLLFPFFYELYKLNEISILVGGIVGLIVGLAIGISRDISSRNMAKRIFESLNQIDDTL